MLWQNFNFTLVIPKYFLSKSTMSSKVALPRTSRPAHRHLPLPPKIRNLIYTYVLRENTKSSNWILRSHANQKRIDAWRPSTKCLSLLLISRQTFLEAYPIYYRINLFCFESVDILHEFLKNVGIARRQHVMRICFCWKGVDAKKTCRLLTKCPRLSYLEIVVYEERQSDHPYLPGVTECECLREIRGLKTVAFRCEVSERTGSTIYDQPEKAADLDKLCDAMRRPRLDRFKATSEAEINPLKPKREIHRGWSIPEPRLR